MLLLVVIACGTIWFSSFRKRPERHIATEGIQKQLDECPFTIRQLNPTTYLIREHDRFVSQRRTATSQVLTTAARISPHLREETYAKPPGWTNGKHPHSERYGMWDLCPKQDVQVWPMEHQNLHRPPPQPDRLSPLPHHPLALPLRPHSRSRSHPTPRDSRRLTPISRHTHRILSLQPLLPRAARPVAKTLALQLHGPALSTLHPHHLGAAQPTPRHHPPPTRPPHPAPRHHTAYPRPHAG